MSSRPFHARTSTGRGGAAGRWLIAAVVLLVGFSGLLKLVDLDEFRSALMQWSLIPSPAIPWLSVLVPSAEIALAGLWWLTRSGRQRVGGITLVLLCVFTLAYAIQSAHTPALPCGCFGAIVPDYVRSEEMVFVYGRNGVLIAMLIAGMLLRRGDESPSTVAARVSMRVATDRSQPSSARSEGFTLIETILVVAIIAIVIAMTLPSLSMVRLRGREIASQSQIRSHASIMLLYATDQRDAWPAYTFPDATSSVMRFDGGANYTTIGYFQMSTYWPVALADGYYDGKWADKSFRSPSRRPGAEGLHDYFYPCSFIAVPEYWNSLTRSRPPSQLRGTRVADVLFPDKKILLVDEQSRSIAWLDNPKQRVVSAQVDGRATSNLFTEFVLGFQSGDGVDLPEHFAAHRGGLYDLLHTIDGVRGRDIAR